MRPAGAVRLPWSLELSEDTRCLVLDVNRREGLGQQELMPRFPDENIQQSGMAVCDKFHRPVIPHSAGVRDYREALRPLLIVVGDPPVPILVLDGIRQHIEGTVKSKLCYNIFDCLSAEAVVAVMLRDRRINGIPASRVRLK